VYYKYANFVPKLKHEKQSCYDIASLQQNKTQIFCLPCPQQKLKLLSKTIKTIGSTCTNERIFNILIYELTLMR